VPVIEISAGEWLSIITHVKKWVRNLLRARTERKRASKAALRSVVKAVRETMLYMRSLREGAPKAIEKERELSLLWTELAFELEDLDLDKLAGRCTLKGRYWADPALFDAGFLDRAGNRLADIEALAMESIQALEKNTG
jgi:hypothetical protein